MTPRGFTLAELLIALAILGVIATFTIPKVLNSQRSQEWNAAAKEAASMVSGTFQSYLLDNTLETSPLSAVTAFNDLTPYMNYVKFISVGAIDNDPGSAGDASCVGTYRCYLLHSGGVLAFRNNLRICPPDTAFFFFYDPDGTTTGTATNENNAIRFFLYPNGRLTTYDSILPNTYQGFSCPGSIIAPRANSTPEWFAW